MKSNIYILFIRCILVATLLLWITPVHAQSPFRARHQLDNTRNVNVVVTSADTIALSGYSAVYAFSLDAAVEQPNEGSFVRVVLEDTEGHDYLVLESDRFRNDTSSVLFSQHCEETSLLPGITPARLKCYATGSAILHLTGIHAATQHPSRDIATPEARRSIRREQAQEVVNRINAYNEAHCKLWRAGVTNRVLNDFDSDEDKALTNSYLANFKYYTDGIYEMGERPATRDTYQSPYVSHFDWRDRHGKNWMTSIKNQGATGFCSAFATIGMLEARTNLHFNNSAIDLNLSEQCLLNYITPPAGITSVFEQLLYIYQYGVIDSLSLPYCNGYTYPNYPRPDGIECVSFDGSRWFTRGADFNQFQDTIKYALIHYGPGVWGFKYPSGHEEIVYGHQNFYHDMTLVGYGTITQEDVSGYVPFTQIEQSAYNPASPASQNMLGETYWIFKDSYGGYSDSTYHHNGYRYVLFHNEFNVNQNAYFIYGSIVRRDHTDAEIICEDADGDGYYCWGLGPRPTNLPAWAELEEDSNDSNDSIGTIDIYGHPRELNYGCQFDEYISIREDQTDTTSKFVRGCMEITANVTDTIQGTIVFHPNACLFLNNNCTIIVDGGTIVDPPFDCHFGPDCSIILRNGGEIIYTKHKPNFTLPLGLSLKIEKGGIRYERDFR